MKWELKYLLLFTFLLTLGYIRLDAQPCPPDDITFVTQSQVDSFPLLYPNCIHIDHGVFIGGSNITNLDSLIQLESIGSCLHIIDADSLVDIEGLSGLTHIGGDIRIGYNPMLTSLIGLNNIDSNNRSIWIYNNDSLINMRGLEGLNTVDSLLICDNGSLTSLNGLENLSAVNYNLIISVNVMLDSLTEFSKLHYIKGDFYIGGTYYLSNLLGLNNLDSIGGYLALVHNYSMNNLIGMENLKKIGGYVSLWGEYKLEDLMGLQGLKFIGDGLYIAECDSIATLSGLDSLTSVGEGDLTIINNYSLQSLNGIDNIEAESMWNLKITENPQLIQCEVQSICDYIANPNGSIEIHSNYYMGCNSPEQVEEACESVGIPEHQSDYQLSAYPNPFSSSTNIKYELTEPTNVQLTIYNAIGETIYKAEDRLMPVGKHTFTWSPENLPEGLYYGVLRREKRVSVVKMVKQY